jgi:hypothetical protein
MKASIFRPNYFEAMVGNQKQISGTFEYLYKLKAVFLIQTHI